MAIKHIQPSFKKVPINIMKTTILVAKALKKPIIPKLIAYKKSRKLKKRYNLLQHYSYGYMKEYQFSPSHSPLICYRKNTYKKKSEKNICTTFLYNCLGRLEDDYKVDGMCKYTMDYHMETLPVDDAAVEKQIVEFVDFCGEEEEEEKEVDDCVDERAERFIERFYEEIRMQKNQTFLQLDGMV